MKKHVLSASLVGCALLIFSLCLSFTMKIVRGDSPLLIESDESVTIEGGAVFNKIASHFGWDQDIWEMKQSHGGHGLAPDQWDSLRIVVDKRTRPYQVSYHQLKEEREVEYRVSCYICHSNGPRAVHPKFESANAPLSLKNKLTLSLWNLRIKSYGNVTTLEAPPMANKQQRQIPLLFTGKIENQTLKVKTCTLCHNEQSCWGRGELKRQHFLPIKHMLKKHHMPPWPWHLSLKDREELARFTLSSFEDLQ